MYLGYDLQMPNRPNKCLHLRIIESATATFKPYHMYVASCEAGKHKDRSILPTSRILMAAVYRYPSSAVSTCKIPLLQIPHSTAAASHESGFRCYSDTIISNEEKLLPSIMPVEQRTIKIGLARHNIDLSRTDSSLILAFVLC